MKTQDRLVVAAATSVEVVHWQAELDAVMARIGSRFARSQPRARVAAFVRGLLAGLPRTTCWSIAEHAGQDDPRGMQRLLSEAVWDTDAVRDDLRSYVCAHLSAPGGVLVVDETGDVKKGTKTVGVQRQYCGTAGRVENCQVAVYLAYATTTGYTLIDHALYLPASWTRDSDRMAVAGVPEEVTFATKTALAQQMITRSLDAGVEASWVAGDEVYGNAASLRTAIATQGLGFVLAVATTHPILTGIGTRHAVDYAVRPDLRWHRYSAGNGAHGPRQYDWARVQTSDPALPEQSPPGTDWLLLRRSIRTGELAFYRAHAPGPVTLKTLVSVAGSRWRIEDSFAGVKELAALDHHQSAPGPPGTAGPCSPCSPTPSSPSWPHKPQTRTRTRPS